MDIHAKLSESEKLMKEMSETWEEKLVKTGKEFLSLIFFNNYYHLILLDFRTNTE